jgi:hypothetical protein
MYQITSKIFRTRWSGRFSVLAALVGLGASVCRLRRQCWLRCSLQSRGRAGNTFRQLTLGGRREREG